MTPEQILFREQQWLSDDEGSARLPNVLFSLLVEQQSSFGPVEPITSVQPYPYPPPYGHSELYAYKTRYRDNISSSRFL